METSWIHKYISLKECLQDLFPLNFNTCLEMLKKFRPFYEAILTKTWLTIIIHNAIPQNPKQIDFSKIGIQRVLSLEDWRQHPWKRNKCIYQNMKHSNLILSFFILDHYLIPGLFFSIKSIVQTFQNISNMVQIFWTRWDYFT